MGKVETQGKVKNTFGIILLLFRLVKVGKVGNNFSNNGQSSDPRQSWGYFWTNLASFEARQSWQSWDKGNLIMGKVQNQGKVGKVGKVEI